MLPPLKKQRIANELEPGRKLKLRVLEHGFQAIGSNVCGILDFVQIRLEINVRLNKKDVIDYLGMGYQ